MNQSIDRLKLMGPIHLVKTKIYKLESVDALKLCIKLKVIFGVVH